VLRQKATWLLLQGCWVRSWGSQFSIRRSLCGFPSQLIILQSALSQSGKNPAHGGATTDLITGDQAKEQQLANTLTLPMPSQAIATRASRQAIVSLNAPALLTLNDVVNLPIAGQIAVHPAACFENYRVATKMAVTFGLLPNAP